MSIRTEEKGITFKVFSVEPAANLLAVGDQGTAITRLLSIVDYSEPIKLLAWSGYNSKVVNGVEFHPLLAATHLAFSEHRPLVLSPDMIWTTILQGLANHIRNNSEKLRKKIVSHEGRKELVISRDDIFLDSPETAWDAAVHDLSVLLRNELGEKYDALAADFSTTGDIERTVSEIALMDAFEPYFDYRMYCVCGIPEITLEGTTADWSKMRAKVEALVPYELDWWLPHLRGILDQFERASRGDIDVEHWQDIYKLRKAYGWDHINGWIVKLIPYVKSGDKVYDRQNPLLFKKTGADWETKQQWFGGADNVSTNSVPSGISLVPFKLGQNGRMLHLQLMGGFVGVEQNEETLALRPKLGWAVRKAPECQWMPEGVGDNCTIAPPLPVEDFSRQVAAITPESPRFADGLKNEFANFYRQCDGLSFTADAGGRSARILPLKEIRTQGDWAKVAQLRDGTVVGFQLVNEGGVCKLGPNGKPGQRVAVSFNEFLKKFMDSEGDL